MPPSTSRSTSSPSRRARRSTRSTAPASSRVPTRTTRRILYDVTQEVCEAARPAGLRDLQPRPAGRRIAAQPRLLALRRICRHRPRRAWPPRDRQRAPCDRDREASRDLARTGRAGGQRHRRRRAPHGRGRGRRVAPHGASPRGGHRPDPLCGLVRPPARRGAASAPWKPTAFSSARRRSASR